ncbi:hypothetical protein F5883DRAFT_243470 [Diaporthe sp. PMI_573]|nr:hypothetical protein F5883DRAFT_243470 [Diaporthaceae sp. PMI_573]
MLNASFLCKVTVPRRLNIGPGYPFWQGLSCCLLTLIHRGCLREYLGVYSDNPSYSDAPFDSGTEDACSQNDTADMSDNARRSAEFTSERQRGVQAIFVLGDIDREGNIGGNYVANNVGGLESSPMQMSRRCLHSRVPKKDTTQLYQERDRPSVR